MIIRGVIALAILAILSAGLAFVFKAGKNAERVVHLKELDAANRRTVAVQTYWTKQYEEGIKNGNDREIATRAAVDSAHATNDGLRAQLSDTARRLAAGVGASATDTATTYAELFAECSTRRLGLAEACTRHVNDIKTLIEVWPKNATTEVHP